MRNLFLLTFAGCLLAPAAGCGNSHPNTAKVKGTITYKNQPVKGGTIRFIAADGTGMSQGPISTAGSYEITDLPPGKKIIVIDTESLNPDRKIPSYGGGKGKMDKALEERMKATGTAGAVGGEVSAANPAAQKEFAERYVKIPVKYSMEQLSPLSTELQSGWNTFDISLTD